MSFKFTQSSPGLPFPGIATSKLFTRFRGSNNPLSEFEARVFKDHTLAAALGNLSAVDSRIKYLQARLAAAQADRRRCQRLVDECRGVLSALRRFPPEILTEIFRWSCMMSNNIVDIAQGPWLISHVCSLWRRVVLSTPSLWIYISLCNSFLHNGRAYPSDSCALLRAALLRSKDLLLRVHFRKDVAEPNWFERNPAAAAARRINNDWLDIVVDVSERWQHCYFYFVQDTRDERRLDIVKGRVNQLETLGIQFSRAGGSEVLEVVDTFQVAPKLRSVEFYEVNDHRFELPLAQLTRVREYWDDLENYAIDFPQQPLDSLQRYMAHCPALRRLDLAHLFYEPFSLYDVPLISHALLRSLTISDEHLLDLLDLPSLEELNVKTRAGPLSSWWGSREIPRCSSEMYHSILKLLQRSRCSLKCLKVVDAKSDVLRDILQLTPALEELKLRYSRFERSLFTYTMYALAQAKPDLLRRLQTLSLSFYSPPREDGSRVSYSKIWTEMNANLLSAIDTRHRCSGGQLQNVKIVSCGFIPPPVLGEYVRPMEEMLERLRERACTAHGVNISVIALYCSEARLGEPQATITKVVYI